MIDPPRRRVVRAVRLVTLVLVFLAIMLGVRPHGLPVRSRGIIDSALGLLLVLGLLGPVLLSNYIGQPGRARQAANRYGSARSRTVTRLLIRRQAVRSEDAGLALALTDHAVGIWWVTYLVFLSAVLFGLRAAIATDTFTFWFGAAVVVVFLGLTGWFEHRRRRIVSEYLATTALLSPSGSDTRYREFGGNAR